MIDEELLDQIMIGQGVKPIADTPPVSDPFVQQMLAEEQSLSTGMPQPIQDVGSEGNLSTTSNIGMENVSQLPEQPTMDKTPYDDIRWAKIPEETPIIQQIKSSFNDMFTNDPQGRLENIKNLFGDKYKGQELDKDGNILINIKQGDEIKKFYLDAPNDDLISFLADTPDFAWEALKFYYGSKGMGFIGSKIGLNPVTTKIGKSLVEAGKGALIEGTTRLISSEGDVGASVQDAGVEGASSILMDTILGSLGFAGRTARKLPFVGESITKAEGALKGWVLGAFGGNKKLGETLGLMTDTPEMIKELKKGLRKNKDGSINISNFAERLVRENQDIPKEVRENLIKDLQGIKAEYLIGYSMLRNANKTVRDVRRQVQKDLDSIGFDKNVMDDFKGMSDIQFLRDIQEKGLISDDYINIIDDISLLRSYLESPETAFWKPSQILNAEWRGKNDWFRGTVNDSLEDATIYLKANVLKENPQTIKEYIDIQNKILNDMKVRLRDFEGHGMSVQQIEKTANNIDRLTINLDAISPKEKGGLQSIKELISDSPLVTGLATGAAFGDIATGGMAAGGSMLLKLMAKKNPKLLIDKLSRLAYLQRVNIEQVFDKKGFFLKDKIVQGMTPEQVITAQRYLKTREMKDLMKFLGHNFRRQELEPDFKATVEELNIEPPIQEETNQSYIQPMSNRNQGATMMYANEPSKNITNEDFSETSEGNAMLGTDFTSPKSQYTELDGSPINNSETPESIKLKFKEVLDRYKKMNKEDNPVEYAKVEKELERVATILDELNKLELKKKQEKNKPEKKYIPKEEFKENTKVFF